MSVVSDVLIEMMLIQGVNAVIIDVEDQNCTYCVLYLYSCDVAGIWDIQRDLVTCIKTFVDPYNRSYGGLTLESISGEDWPEISWLSYIVVEDYGMWFLY